MPEHILPQEPRDVAEQQELHRLIAVREREVTRIFWLALEIAFVFLIPALAVALIVPRIWSQSVAWFLLPFSFVASWGIVIVRYRHLSRKLEGLDKKIKELRNQND